MITEDYVSFEVAKLLKEKGFPQEYDIYHSMVYNEEDYKDEYEVQRMVLQTRFVKAGTLSSYPVGVPEPKCYCPTHQMAMKWLREVHKIVIVIDAYHADHWEGYIDCFEISIYSHASTMIVPNEISHHTEYTEAVEAALKYVLENLI